MVSIPLAWRVPRKSPTVCYGSVWPCRSRIWQASLHQTTPDHWLTRSVNIHSTFHTPVTAQLFPLYFDSSNISSKHPLCHRKYKGTFTMHLYQVLLTYRGTLTEFFFYVISSPSLQKWYWVEGWVSKFDKRFHYSVTESRLYVMHRRNLSLFCFFLGKEHFCIFVSTNS